ncbi:MAG: PDZ domain-containing protein [Planctomycetia bacterium]|nr:PDZ domain-containing protein [Planctomycetia bacterium]
MVITSLYIDGPAQVAGLRTADQILSINGQALITKAQLIDLVDRFQPRERVDVLVARNGWTNHFFVTLGQRSMVASLPRTQQPTVANRRVERRYSYKPGEYIDDQRALMIYDPYLRALYTNFGP